VSALGRFVAVLVESGIRIVIERVAHGLDGGALYPEPDV